MKQNQWKNILPSLWATVSIFVFSGTLFFLYQKSQYLLFQLGGVFLLILAAVNLLLLLFGKEISQKSLAENNTNEPNQEETAEIAKKKTVFDILKRLIKYIKPALLTVLRFLARIYRPAQIILLAFTLIGGFVWFSTLAWSSPAESTLSYWHLVLLVTLFVVAIVIDKLCKYAKTETKFCAMLVRNARAFFAIIKFVLILLSGSVALKLLNIYDVQKYIIYVMVAFFYYAVAMIFISLAVRILRREMTSAPGLVIILPFLNADIKELAVISFLEQNTGITLRSLWSIKYVKQVIPYAVFAAAILFWASTGIVYVQSHQEAAVYRFGHLQEDVLSPGLHLTLPYPFDKTDIYDTATVNKMTIGYKSTENIDNVWTEAHGENEYKLLLGSGTELVSINLRVEYKVSDLMAYLKTSTSPERILEAKAYELVTDRTISTDLDSILSTNRETFAKTLHTELSSEIAKLDIGLEVVSVIMESIHPPVEVAEVYQAFIGAEIDAEEMILTAQGAAAVTIAEAESIYHKEINYAHSDYYIRLSAAKVEIAEFMAAVEASNAFPDEYAYRKYLEAICTAYQKSKLIILGDGVDGTRLYFGNFNSLQ